MRSDRSREGLLPGLRSLAIAGLSLVSFGLPGGLPADPPAAPERPAITDLRLEGTNLLVRARVPTGLRKITLEARAQVGRGSWEPRAVVRLDGTGGDVTFRLRQSTGMELLRLRASAQEPLPAFFYAGTNVFASASGQGTVVEPIGPVAGVGPWDIYASADANGSGRPETAAPREVAESDIWKLAGDTLFFFNQNRGLQVIDLRAPDTPVVTGRLDLPGAGEQMYLLGTDHVVLLAQDACAGASQALVVEVGNGPPKTVATLAIPGYLRESRLVGQALYVASQVARSTVTTDGLNWESGTLISAFDLAAPAQPVARETLWLGCCEEAVAATDRYFFVSVPDPTNYWCSVLHAIDISDPGGVMKLAADIRPAGRVQDKFKLNLDGSVLSVVSEESRWTDPGLVQVTRLETFDLSGAEAPRLGSLELVRGEQVYASRFAGQRAYVVTFRRIDPLWVVDLSDPARPRVAGEIEVPGWSTYIHPIGDRLVTVGYDNTNGSLRVAVQLFDVSQPARPILLDKAPLGDGYTWSEATADEKAFNVLEEAGLILIPYSGWTTNGQAQRVQLIDLDAGSLRLRGVIDHQVTPRRATLHRDRIVSLSGLELLSVDASDRDHPEVRGRLELAWPVDRLFLAGDYLVELTTGAQGWTWGWQGSSAQAPRLRVSPAARPDEVLQTYELPQALPLAGATVREGRLYLAQVNPEAGWIGPIIPWVATTGSTDGSETGTEAPKDPNFLLTVIDLTELPVLRVAAQTAAAVEPLGYGPTLEAVWPRADLLVWSGGASGWPWYWGWDGLALPVAGGPQRLVGGLWWPYFGGQGGRLIAFDVSQSTTPRFCSDVNLSTNGGWNFSPAFSDDGLVFLSHDLVDYRWVFIPLSAEPDISTGGREADTGFYYWVQRSFLDVVDYADARLPTVRRAVNIPGRLEGLSHQGALLYTAGQHADADGASDYRMWLDVSAYDGVSASLVASLELPNEWPSPRLVWGTNIFLGRPTGGNAAGQLERWALDEVTGKLALLGTLALPAAAQAFGAVDAFLAVQSPRRLDLFNPNTLQSLGGEPNPTCLWLDLAHAQGVAEGGVWIPLGPYGVKRVGLSP